MTHTGSATASPVVSFSFELGLRVTDSDWIIWVFSQSKIAEGHLPGSADGLAFCVLCGVLHENYHTVQHDRWSFGGTG